MLVKAPYNRNYGYILGKELAPSQLDHEDIKQYVYDRSVIRAFNYLRFVFANPLRVTSPGRSYAFNKKQKGAATNSKHLILLDENGKQERPVYAMDFQPVNGDLERLKALFEDQSPMLYFLGIRGVGFYDSFIHMDSAPRGNNFEIWAGSGAELPRLKKFSLWGF